MGEWSANRQARAKAVWDKLLGYFGDALLRKFDAEPPDEWVEAIDSLNDFQVRRGFKRLYGWKGSAPNLPDFMRLCRAIGDDAAEDGPVERVSVPRIEGQKFDGWDISGNERFLKYVAKRLTGSHRPWGRAWSEEHAECTRIAVAYKNAWAQDMREACSVNTATGEIQFPPKADQERTFAECMARAENDIAAYRLRLAA